MSTNQLEPAKSIIAKIGVRKCAELTGKSISRVYRWMAPKERGGTGGFIPTEEAAVILAHAKREGLELTADEFFLPEEAVQ